VLVWGVVCTYSIDGDEEVDTRAFEALREVSVDGEELAVDESLDKGGEGIKPSRGVGRDLFDKADEADKVGACLGYIGRSVWTQVGDGMDGEVGDKGVLPDVVPVHRFGAVESARDNADSESVERVVVVAEGVVVLSSGDGGGNLVVWDSLKMSPPEVFSDLAGCRHLV